MNIKKIILEELEDFDWIRNIDPNEELYEPWVRKAIDIMDNTIYFFDSDIGKQIGLLKRHPRSKKIIEDAIRTIWRKIVMNRIGEHRYRTEEEYEEDKKFLEGYELLKKSIEPKIYNRMLKRLK